MGGNRDTGRGRRTRGSARSGPTAGVDGGREEAAEDELRTPQAQAVGFGQPYGDVINDRVTAELLVLDEAASRLLAGVARGRVVPEPVLTKVRSALRPRSPWG